MVGALAMSEAGSGSDVMSMKLTANKDGRHFFCWGVDIVIFYCFDKHDNSMIHILY